VRPLQHAAEAEDRTEREAGKQRNIRPAPVQPHQRKTPDQPGKAGRGMARREAESAGDARRIRRKQADVRGETAELKHIPGAVPVRHVLERRDQHRDQQHANSNQRRVTWR